MIKLGILIWFSLSLIIILISWILLKIKFNHNMFEGFFRRPWREIFISCSILFAVWPLTLWSCHLCFDQEMRFLEEKREKTPWWKLKKFGGNV